MDIKGYSTSDRRSLVSRLICSCTNGGEKSIFSKSPNSYLHFSSVITLVARYTNLPLLSTISRPPGGLITITDTHSSPVLKKTCMFPSLSRVTSKGRMSESGDLWDAAPQHATHPRIRFYPLPCLVLTEESLSYVIPFASLRISSAASYLYYVETFK